MKKRSTATLRSGPRPKADLRFRHILVPTDLTERTDKALQLAGRLSSRDRTRITMVHIIETIEGLPFEDLRPFYRRMERKARTAMKLLAKRAPEGAVNATRPSSMCDPACEVLASRARYFPSKPPRVAIRRANPRTLQWHHRCDIG